MYSRKPAPRINPIIEVARFFLIVVTRPTINKPTKISSAPSFSKPEVAPSSMFEAENQPELPPDELLVCVSYGKNIDRRIIPAIISVYVSKFFMFIPF